MGKEQWTTWWSRSQRGLAAFAAVQETAVIRLQLQDCPAFSQLSLIFANRYGAAELGVKDLQLEIKAPAGIKEIVAAADFSLAGGQACHEVVLAADCPSNSEVWLSYRLTGAGTSGFSLADEHFAPASQGIVIINQKGQKDQLLLGLTAIAVLTQTYCGTLWVIRSPKVRLGIPPCDSFTTAKG